MINKQFKTMNIKDLIPYENNPRINDDAVNDMGASIPICTKYDKFGNFDCHNQCGY